MTRVTETLPLYRHKGHACVKHTHPNNYQIVINFQIQCVCHLKARDKYGMDIVQLWWGCLYCRKIRNLRRRSSARSCRCMLNPVHTYSFVHLHSYTLRIYRSYLKCELNDGTMILLQLAPTWVRGNMLDQLPIPTLMDS